MEPGGGAAKESAVEPWMLANLALGMGQMAFLPLLMVPFVVDVSGDPQAGGVIAALVGLSALLGPVIGGVTDRYRAHRLVVTLALFGLSASANCGSFRPALLLGSVAHRAGKWRGDILATRLHPG
jgi:predicted MFS family arabinose efflux permease